MKLDEAKSLWSQNIELVEENMCPKSEVASRSPEKFDRYTVAALEAEIHDRVMISNKVWAAWRPSGPGASP